MTEFTPEELIEYLKLTQLPTIIVEGTGDVRIYRWIENFLQGKGYNVSIIQAGGREGVFRIHDNIGDFQQIPIIMTADLDGFLFTGVPVSRKDIIFTTGYSIENDIIDLSYFEKLMDSSELTRLEELKVLSSQWFAGQVDELRRLGNWKVKCNINSVIDCNTMSHRARVEFSTLDYDYIMENFSNLLRGKNIYECLLIIFNDKSRGPDKYSLDNLVSLSVTHGSNPNKDLLMMRIIDKLENEFKRLKLAI